MGFWKAEEIQKFCFPASEVVFGGVLPDSYFKVWSPVVKIVECLFGCGRNGSNPEMQRTLEQLIWRHNILTEEIEGGKICLIWFTTLFT